MYSFFLIMYDFMKKTDSIRTHFLREMTLLHIIQSIDVVYSYALCLSRDHLANTFSPNTCISVKTWIKPERFVWIVLKHGSTLSIYLLISGCCSIGMVPTISSFRSQPPGDLVGGFNIVLLGFLKRLHSWRCL